MKRISILLFSLVVFNSYIALAGSDSNSSNYLNFCSLVSEAMSLNADAQTQHEFIKDNLDKNAGSKDIKDAYGVIYQIAPEKRYEVFKKAIEKQTGAAWDCAELKKYFEQYVKKQ